MIRYGLLERCERQIIDFPGPGQNGRIHYTDYSCRAFPNRKEPRKFAAEYCRHTISVTASSRNHSVLGDPRVHSHECPAVEAGQLGPLLLSILLLCWVACDSIAATGTVSKG